MSESETVLWIKGQLSTGKSSSEVREMLARTGYAAEEAERLISLVMKDDALSRNDKKEPIVQPAVENQERKKRSGDEESLVKVGAYAAATMLIVSAIVIMGILFFDNLSVLNYPLFTILSVLLVTSIIANRMMKSSIIHIAGAIFVSNTIFLIGSIIMLYFVGGYIFNVSIFELDSNEYVVSPFQLFGGINNALIIMIISGMLGVLPLVVVTVIVRALMKKLKIPKLNILMPIAIIAVLFFIGIAAYSFTGAKIAHDPIDVYWCDKKSDSELCHTEDMYETMQFFLTGYRLDSYFSEQPNSNNRLAMNKYELATGIFSMTNFASIGFQDMWVRSVFYEMNRSDDYYDNVVKKSRFNVDEIKNAEEKNRVEALILCMYAYKSYLNNLKTLVEDANIDYGDEDSQFIDKEQHLKYIQTKININNGLEESYKSLKLNAEEDLEYSFYRRNTGNSIKDAVRSCEGFFIEIGTRIRIADVSFGDVQEGSLTKKVEIRVKNMGVNEIEYEAKDIMIYVNGRPAEDVECTFKVLNVDEEGVCSGTIKNDESLQKRIKLLLPVGPRATYLYEGE